MRMRETGPLERSLGGNGIETQWQQRLKRERRWAGKELLLELRAPHIFDLAETGDARAAELLSSTARLLLEALSTIALLNNPKLIVLGGGVGSHGALCRRTEQFLQENEFAIPPLRSFFVGNGGPALRCGLALTGCG
jgi:glucokinase